MIEKANNIARERRERSPNATKLLTEVQHDADDEGDPQLGGGEQLEDRHVRLLLRRALRLHLLQLGLHQLHVPAPQHQQRRPGLVNITLGECQVPDDTIPFIIPTKATLALVPRRHRTYEEDTNLYNTWNDGDC